MVSTKDSPDPDKEIKTFLASKIEDLDNWKSDERTEQKFQTILTKIVRITRENLFASERTTNAFQNFEM